MSKAQTKSKLHKLKKRKKKFEINKNKLSIKNDHIFPACIYMLLVFRNNLIDENIHYLSFIFFSNL